MELLGNEGNTDMGFLAFNEVNEFWYLGLYWVKTITGLGK